MTRTEWLQEVRLGFVFDEALEAWSDEVFAARAAGSAESSEWRQAVEDALICADLGTAETFPTPKHAINALMCYGQQIGAYFAGERIRKVVGEYNSDGELQAIIRREAQTHMKEKDDG